MNIKKIAASFLAAVMLASSLAINAFAGEFGVADGILDEETGLLYVEKDDGTYKVTYPDGTQPTGDIVIPETFGEGDEAKTVTEMDSSLIYCGYGITSVFIPKTIEKLGETRAFSSNNLQSINVAEDNPAFLSEDGILFDKDKTKLYKYPSEKEGSTYVVPSTVTEICAFGFFDCSLSSIEFPDGLKKLGWSVLGNCSNLENIALPGSLEDVGMGLFNSSGISSVTIDSSCANYCVVDNVLFTSDKKTLVAYPPASTADTYSIPDGTNMLTNGAFGGAYNLKEIEIPNSVFFIGQALACTGITSLKIPEGITMLYLQCFLGCDALTSVYIPVSVTEIGREAFGNGDTLKVVNYGGTKEDWDKIVIEEDNEALNKATINFYTEILDEETGILYVPLSNGTLKATFPKDANPKGDIVIPETYGKGENAKTVTEIDGGDAYRSGCNVTSIKIPKTIEKIKLGGVFTSWTLERITVAEDNAYFSSEDGVLFNKDKTEILRYPEKKDGTHYTIPSTVSIIEADCFSWSPIESVVIPNSVKVIGGGAFSDCSNLKALNIPMNVESIGDNLTAGSGIVSITVDPANTHYTDVDGVLFTVDKEILVSYPAAKPAEEYTVPDGTVEIRSFSFSGAEHLKKINIPESVCDISYSAFCACANLREVNIPSKVERIDMFLFAWSASLETVTIPLSVKYIGIYAFAGCNSLKTINYEGTKEDWDKIEILSGNDALNNIILQKYSEPDLTLTINRDLGNTWKENFTVPAEVFKDVTADTTIVITYKTDKTLTGDEEYWCIKPFRAEPDGWVFMSDWIIDPFLYTGDSYNLNMNSDRVSFKLSVSNTIIDGKEVCGGLEFAKKNGITFMGHGIEVLEMSFYNLAKGTENRDDVLVQLPDTSEKEDGTVDFTPAVKKNLATTDSDINTMKKIKANAPADAFDENVVLNVSHDTFAGDSSSFAVDISFVDGKGDKVQPKDNAKVTVKIPLPENLKNKYEVFVYHVNDEGKAEKIKATTEIIDGVKYMVFEADSFSTYVLSAESGLDKEDNPKPDDPKPDDPEPDDPIIDPLPDDDNSSDTPDSTTSDTTSSNTTSSDTTSSDTTNSDATSSDTTSSEPVSSDSGNSEPTSAPSSSTAPSASENNPGTGIALSFIPLIAAVSAVLVIKKKK